MRESKHTPGPWKISEHLITDDMVVRGACGSWVSHSRRIEGRGGVLLAELTATEKIENVDTGYPCVCSSAEMLANAALIAAAPETAAERDRLKEINKELLEALKTMVDTFNPDHQCIYDFGRAKFNAASAAIAKAEGKTQ